MKKAVEDKLWAGYQAGEIDTGLFRSGLLYVVFDMVDEKPLFTWFDQAKPI